MGETFGGDSLVRSVVSGPLETPESLLLCSVPYGCAENRALWNPSEASSETVAAASSVGLGGYEQCA